MAQTNRPIQIRTLPRTDEGKREDPPKAEKTAFKWNRSYVVIVIVVLLSWLVFIWDSGDAKRTPPSRDWALGDGSPEDKVNQHLRESQMKRQMEMQTRETENQMFAKPLGEDAVIIPETSRTLGVSLEQENNAEKVYNDLYGKQAHVNPAPSPEQKIESRLEQEQWIGQMEKQERKLYVQNFLKQALDAGYAITLDENLIVVKVRKVKERPTQTLDQVLENLTRKGY